MFYSIYILDFLLTSETLIEMRMGLWFDLEVYPIWENFQNIWFSSFFQFIKDDEVCVQRKNQWYLFSKEQRKQTKVDDKI